MTRHSIARSVCMVACFVAAPLLSACAKPAASHNPTSATPAAAAEAQQEKKPRFGEAAVYVDGALVGVVRAPELPATLQTVKARGGDDTSKIYAMKDYVTSLGVDVSKIRGVQIYGGKRVSVLSGDEFRRMGARIRFAFTGNDHGKPGLLWPHEHIVTNTIVGSLSSLTIYVDKEPPTVAADGSLLYADGAPVEGVPYAPAEQGKGTRIYVDGKLTGIVKRKSIPSSLLVGNDPAHPKFSVAGYLSSVGVNPQDAKSIDFVSNDDTFLRMSASDIEKTKALTFTIPAHSQGQIAMPRLQADASDTLKVSAVQIFVKSTPSSRAISVPPSAPSGGGGDGSGNGKTEDSALE